MIDSKLLKSQVREFVSPIAERVGVRSFSDDESLTAAGILSSLAIFRTVAFLEETFSVTIADEDIVMENFDSIDKITLLVTSKARAA